MNATTTLKNSHHSKVLVTRTEIADLAGRGVSVNKEIILGMLKRPIAFHRPLVPISGSVAGAVWLSQLVYWTGRGADMDGWIYKTMGEWEGETGLGRREQEAVRSVLRGAGLLCEKRRGVPARLFYKLDLDRLADMLNLSNKIGGNEQSSLAESDNLVCTNTPNKNEQFRQTNTETTANTIQRSPLPDTTGVGGGGDFIIAFPTGIPSTDIRQIERELKTIPAGLRYMVAREFTTHFATIRDPIGWMRTVCSRVRDSGEFVPAASRSTHKVLSKPDQPWFLSASGIEGMGAKLGIVLKRDESFQDFKRRVMDAANVTKDSEVRDARELNS